MGLFKDPSALFSPAWQTPRPCGFHGATDPGVAFWNPQGAAGHREPPRTCPYSKLRCCPGETLIFMLGDPGPGLERSTRRRQCQLPSWPISFERGSQCLLLALLSLKSVVVILNKVAQYDQLYHLQISISCGSCESMSLGGLNVRPQ